MKRVAFPLLLSLFTLLPLTSCKNPFDRTKDASNGGAIGTFGTGNLVMFFNELQTGGGAFLYPSGENQTLSFADTSNPISARSIRYAWNGQDVPSQFGLQHLFAGFDLMHTALQSSYSSTPGRDLRAAGYTHVTFFARGTLSVNTLVKVEVSDDGDTGTPAPCLSLSPDGTLDDGVNVGSTACGVKAVLSSSWLSYSIPIANSNLSPLKDFFKATMIFNQPIGNIPGQGGVVYFDNIQYAP